MADAEVDENMPAVPQTSARKGIKRCDTCGCEKHQDKKLQDDDLPKAVGYTPLLSQLASLLYIISGNRTKAGDFQKLFAQGIVNFFKGLLRVVYIIVCCQIRQKKPSRSLPKDIHQHSWMSRFQHVRLWDLCLPGTHNSHAYKCQPSPVGTDWVLCQKLTVRQQLERGIRMLDLRVNSREYFGHGIAGTSKLDVVARDIVSFLQTNPTEVVVCLVKSNGGHATLKEHETPVGVVRTALAEAHNGDAEEASNEQCTCGKYEISIDAPESEGDSNMLKQQSLSDLTNNGTKGKVIVDDWSNWEGSWHFTRSNNTKQLEQKSKDWAETRSRNEENGQKPRVLELILTVDAGTTRQTIQLATIHSVESMNRGLVRQIEKDKLLSPPVLNKFEGLILDYPTKAQLYSIILYNHGAIAEYSS